MTRTRDKANDEAFEASLSARTKAEIVETRRQLLSWTTGGAKFMGDMFGQRQLEDRFLGQVAFDVNNQCIVFEEKDGVTLVSDITEGFRMAGKPGFEAAECRASVVSKCGSCGLEPLNAGDQSILMNGTGPDVAVDWCQKCYALKYAKDNLGKQLTTLQFR